MKPHLELVPPWDDGDLPPLDTYQDADAPDDAEWAPPDVAAEPEPERARDVDAAAAAKGARDVDDTRDVAGDRPEAEPEPEAAVARVADATSGPPWETPAPLGRDAEPPPFPIGTLPAWVADYVRAEAANVQVPLDMPACFAIGALSAVTGGNVRVTAWPGFRDASNLYTLIAAEPGELKSVVHRHVTAPIVAFERGLAAEREPEVRERGSQRSVLEARLKRAVDRAARAEDEQERGEADEKRRLAQAELDAMPEIVSPRLIVDDSTPEQLKSLLAQHGGRLAMLSADSGLFGNFVSKRYSADPNIEVLLAAHAGDEVRVDRRGRQEYIPDPRLVICVAVQPGVLAAAYRHPIARERGLFDRFLYSAPRSIVGERDFGRMPPPMPASVREAWSAGLDELASRYAFAPEPRELRLERDARERFRAWRASIEPRRRVTGDLASMPGWAAKLDGAALRLAGLLHVADGERGDEVRVDTLDAATRLLESYFVPHAMRAFDAMSEDEDAARARKVLAWVEGRRAPSFTRDEVRAGFKGRLNAGELTPILDSLVSLGHLRRSASQPRGGRGRPVERFDVHPRYLG